MNDPWFLSGYLSAFPVAPAIRSLPEAKRRALFRRMATLLKVLRMTTGWRHPWEAKCLPPSNNGCAGAMVFADRDEWFHSAQAA